MQALIVFDRFHLMLLQVRSGPAGPKPREDLGRFRTVVPAKVQECVALLGDAYLLDKAVHANVFPM